MKPGDLVRFRPAVGFDWEVGLLIEYFKWEKLHRYCMMTKS